MQPNFGGMVLGWSPSKLCPVILTSNQDGRQAKIEKRGDEIFLKSSPLKLLSQSQPNFAEMILGWFPSKIVSGISDLLPRWLPQPNLVYYASVSELFMVKNVYLGFFDKHGCTLLTNKKKIDAL